MNVRKGHLSIVVRDGDDEAPLVKPMPLFEIVWAQYGKLAERLRSACKEKAYSAWVGATSGTVIMKNVFTEPRFYSGCEDILYLWLHMATNCSARLSLREWAEFGIALIDMATGRPQ